MPMQVSPGTPIPTSDPERNKAVMRQMLDVFNTGETSIIYELFHPLFADLSPCAGSESTAEGVEQCVLRLRSQFPDAVFQEELLVAEGGTAVMRWKMTGTNTGPIFGRKATGKYITYHGEEFVQFKDGLMIEHVHTPYIMTFLDKLDLLDGDMMQFLKDIGARTYSSAN